MIRNVLRSILNDALGRPKVLRARTHPNRLEAMTLLEGGRVARWTLTDPPRILTEIQTGFAALKDLAVSPDGRFVVVVAEAQEEHEKQMQIRAWDDLALLEQGSFEADLISLSYDGRRITGTTYSTPQLYDRMTGEISQPDELDFADGHSAFFAPSAPLIGIAASASYSSGSVGLARLETDGTVTLLYEAAHGQASNDLTWSVAFSRDSHWMAAVSTVDMPQPWEVQITLYDVTDGSMEWHRIVSAETADTRPWEFSVAPESFYDKAIEVIFRGDQEVLFGTPEGRLLGFSRATGALIRNVPLPPGVASSLPYGKDILSISLQAGGEKVWVVLRDGTFCGIPLAPLPADIVAPPADPLPRIRPSRKLPRARPTLVALSPQGDQALVQLEEGWTPEHEAQMTEGAVQIVDCRTGETIRAFPELSADQELRSAVYSPDGRRIAIDTGPQILIYDVHSGTELCVCPRPDTNVLAIFAFAPDSRRFLAEGEGGTICVWEIESGEKVLEFGEDIYFAAAAQEEALLVTFDGEVTLWDLDTGTPLRLLAESQSTDYQVVMTFLDQDRWLLLLDLETGQIRILDVESGRQVQEFLVEAERLDEIAFSSDGRLLAFGGREPEIWDCETGRPCCRLRGHHYPIDSISFSADGTTLATRNLFSVLLWDTETLPLPTDWP